MPSTATGGNCSTMPSSPSGAMRWSTQLEAALPERKQREQDGHRPLGRSRRGQPPHAAGSPAPQTAGFPAYTAEGKRESDAMHSTWRRNQDFRLDKGRFRQLDRCITRGLPASMMPVIYNNNVPIFQSAGLRRDPLRDDPRDADLPLDGRAAARPRSTSGWATRAGTATATRSCRDDELQRRDPDDDRGARWQADSHERATAHRRASPPHGTGDDRLRDKGRDPVVLTRPWKAAFPLELDPKYRFFEYACHEDNSAVRNFIETSRYERAHAARPR